MKKRERSRRNIHYTGLELYPLDWQTVEQLGISPAMSSLPYIGSRQQPMSNLPLNDEEQQPAIELFKQLHTSPWEKDVQLTPHFTLRKIETDVNQWITGKKEESKMNSTNNNAVISQYSTSNTPFNTIYFDAFAPEKQPEMGRKNYSTASMFY